MSTEAFEKLRDADAAFVQNRCQEWNTDFLSRVARHDGATAVSVAELDVTAPLRTWVKAELAQAAHDLSVRKWAKP